MAYIFRMFPGNRIRQYRKAAKLTQAALGAKIGVHQTYIGNLENGDRPLTLEHARRIANVFGVTVADLLDDRDNPDRLSDEERALIALHRRASSEQKEMIRRVTEAVIPYRPMPKIEPMQPHSDDTDDKRCA